MQKIKADRLLDEETLSLSTGNLLIVTYLVVIEDDDFNKVFARRTKYCGQGFLLFLAGVVAGSYFTQQPSIASNVNTLQEYELYESHCDEDIDNPTDELCFSHDLTSEKSQVELLPLSESRYNVTNDQ